MQFPTAECRISCERDSGARLFTHGLSCAHQDTLPPKLTYDWLLTKNVAFRRLFLNMEQHSAHSIRPTSLPANFTEETKKATKMHNSISEMFKCDILNPSAR